MKLTNISLAVLVALGLVACGGSDDNNNQTTDPKPPKEIPGDGGNGGDDSKTQANEKSGINPERAAPDLTVPADLVDDVKARKEIYLDRGFSDHALGYPNGGTKYLKDEGTDPKDIKHLSMYNFADEEDLIPVSLTTGNSAKFPKGEGAIYVGEDPTQGRVNNAFAKGKDGKYYRVKSPVTPDLYDKNTKFYLVESSDSDITKQREEDSGIEAVTKVTTKSVSPVSQSDVVFIANAGKPTNTSDENYDVLTLGKDGYDLTRNQVVLNSIQVLGKNYNANSVGQALDLNGMDVKREIQIVPVTSTYTITNGKETAQSTDDFTITKNIDLGNIKAYNLPYSIAFVTIDPSKEHEKDIFNTNNYVVDGLQTVSLPKDGRAFYYGKSFNASVEGDIKLTADFFEDRAGVVGTVTNRKNIVTDKKLSDLRLGRLELTSPSGHVTGAKTDTTNKKGLVTGDPKVNSWSVQFYGLEAQEAAGKIYHDTKDYVEVYNTQRGKLSNRSNDAGVQ